MTNKPHSRAKKVSDVTIKVKKKPISSNSKKVEVKNTLKSLIKKQHENQ